MVSSGYCNSWS